MPAPKGNKNAKKNDPKNVNIYIKCTKKKRIACHIYASRKGLTLSGYIRCLINKAALARMATMSQRIWLIG